MTDDGDPCPKCHDGVMRGEIVDTPSQHLYRCSWCGYIDGFTPRNKVPQTKEVREGQRRLDQ